MTGERKVTGTDSGASSAAASLDFGLEPRREQVSYAVEYRRPGGQWTFSHTPDSNRAESGMLQHKRANPETDYRVTRITKIVEVAYV